jgi:CheY-like chemotaxis protein
MKTVLVVDDFASVRFYHISLLRGAGYATLSAANGSEALELLDKQAVDLVLLDLVMPTMNGLEFVNHLRARPHHSVLPVLVITGEIQPDGLAHLAADPACRVLKKPILPPALLAEINHQLG